MKWGGKMLYIYFGYDEEAILSIDTYFNNVYDEEWFEDAFVREMVEDVDGVRVLDKLCIESPVLGQIPPERISGGAKALVLMYMLDGFYVDLIVCGHNCEKWIQAISQKKDIKASLSGFDLSFEKENIVAKCLNDNTMIYGYEEWAMKMITCMGGSNEG